MPDDEPPAQPRDDWRQVDPRLRATAVAAVGAALISWWPAFTLGAYRTVFFEQVLSLWAAATGAFLVLAIVRGHRAVSLPRRLALLVPTGWLIVAFVAPTGSDSALGTALLWLAVTLTLAGGPYLAWVLLRITLIGYDALTRRQRWALVGVVAAVVVVSYTLGRLNPMFLTCDDFTISGNSAPPGCTPGSPTVR